MMGVLRVVALIAGIMVMVVGGIMDMLVRSGAVERGGKYSVRREWRAVRTLRGLRAVLVFAVGMVLMFVGVAILVSSR